MLGNYQTWRNEEEMSTVPPSSSAVIGLESDSKDAGSLKEAGNKAFAKGDLEQAYSVRGCRAV